MDNRVKSSNTRSGGEARMDKSGREGQYWWDGKMLVDKMLTARAEYLQSMRARDAVKLPKSARTYALLIRAAEDIQHNKTMRSD